ncbi:hypothetical protein C882_0672 [Caenispirillum salinarum AK4]|uniref:HNH nuclease domain-containing protein n=1 Tax=Caenispirillum salinarum AK4 TaxID=1238182 RepID=K9GVX4_9PROT|nr:type II CRISPR RNA-guided endonuclease Cas9 [Caenispirillum salinarum]EKV28909.1 hypothetical protein C882_0672 [Caenispirillum salinarum AK4]
MPVLSPLSPNAAQGRRRWSLALDIGEGSIGWAVAEVDAEGRVLQLTGTGVTLFPSAWSNENGTYVAHGAADRAVRGQQQRHDSRRRRLAGLARLCAPVLERSPEDLKDLTRTPPKADPRAIFFLRADAARRPLDGPELFRVLHHMAAHRGIRLAELQEVDPPPESDADDAAPAATEDEDGTRRAAADERAFRRLMAEHMHRHGTQPTCGEIMAGRLRETPAGAQPVTRARDGLRVGGGVAVPTRALIEQEFDAIRAIQAPRHPDLPWDSLRRLVLDQAPIAVPPATPCLFLEELRRRGETFQGRTITREAIDRGLTVDPLIQALRIRETVGNLRLHERITEPDGRQRYVPRAMPELGLSHGELTAPERDTLVRALMHDPDGLAAKDGRIPYTRLRKLIGYDNSPVCFAQERDTSGGGITVNPTDPLMARWIDGWVDLPLKARSLYVRDVVARGADSAALARLLAEGAHGVPPVAAAAVPAATAAILESDIMQPGRYSVCPWAAEAILDAWANAPTEGFYDVTRGLFGFAPGEIVLEDLRRARGALLAHLPRTMAAARTPNRAAQQRGPLPAYESVIPSQLITSLRRAHKGRAADWSAADPEERNPFLRTWTGNAATDHILNQVRKTANEVITKYGNRRGWDPLPSRITVELAREAKHGVIRRNEIAKENRENEGRRKKESAALDTFCQDNTVSWQAGGLPKERAALRLRLAQRQEFFCPYCAERPKLRATDLFSPAETEIDHVIERRMGGDGPDNLVLAHKDCNNAKGKKTPHEHAGDLLDSPALAALWQGWRKENADRLKGKGHKARTPREDKDFMDRVGWRFEEDARAKAEENQERRGRRMLHDTARATRLARLYLAAAVMPEDPAEIGAPPVETPPSPEDPTGYTAIYRTISRVQPVNGSVTHMLRQRLLQRDKNRDYQTHHAEDACLLLLAGPAVVQAFNTEAAQHGADAPDDRPVDLMPTSDAYHQQRRARALGRVPLATVDAALADIVMPESDRQDPETGRVHWRLTRAGRGLKRRIDDLTRNCVILSRPRRPSETGTPGALHNATHYGRREITVDGRTDTVVTQRMNARDLVALLDNAKIVPAARLDAAAPGDTILKEICTEIADRHDRVVDPEGTHARRWISARLAALVPAHAEAVARDIAELADLDALADADRTPEQEARRSALRQSPYLGRAISAKKADGRARAREQEILTRALLDPHWGPRGLRHLIMREARAPSLVRIRANKTDAFGRPVPDAAVWVKTDGNAVSQLWRLTSVVTDDGRRIPLPKPIEKRIEISNLEYARLNGLDEGAGVTGNNAPPRPLRQDIDRLTPLWRDHGTAPGGYLGTAVGELEDKARSALRGKAMRQTLTDAGITAEAGWRLDSEGAVCDLEVAKGDTVKKDGKTYKVGVITQGIFGMPVDAAGSAPRTPEDCEKFEEQYGIKPWKAKGIPLA